MRALLARLLLAPLSVVLGALLVRLASAARRRPDADGATAPRGAASDAGSPAGGPGEVDARRVAGLAAEVLLTTAALATAPLIASRIVDALASRLESRDGR